jgi:hypothetical protein
MGTPHAVHVKVRCLVVDASTSYNLLLGLDFARAINGAAQPIGPFADMRPGFTYCPYAYPEGDLTHTVTVPMHLPKVHMNIRRNVDCHVVTKGDALFITAPLMDFQNNIIDLTRMASASNITRVHS